MVVLETRELSPLVDQAVTRHVFTCNGETRWFVYVYVTALQSRFVMLKVDVLCGTEMQNG